MAVRKLEKVDKSLARLKRVSDLFVEGKEVVLQEDPVVMVWVNKLNSFEDDEARRDGLAFRSLQMIQIERSDGEHPAVASLVADYESNDRQGRADILANLYSQEDLLHAMDEVDSTEKWQERGELIRRGELLDGANLDVESSQALVEESAAYFKEVQTELERRTKERSQEFVRMPEPSLRDDFLKKAAETVSISTFIRERDVTSIYYALRNCESSVPGSHGSCAHERLLEAREQVLDLPDGLVKAVQSALEELDISPREAGNSDAPTPSSGQSEQPSEQEESPASTPMVTSLASLPLR